MTIKKIFFLFLFLNSTAFAQQMLGVHASNNMGVYRATFNPSAIAGTKYHFQINGITLNSTINGRYFKYFRSDALFHPFKNPYSQDELYGKSKSTGTLTQGDKINVISELRGPSAFFDIKDRVSIGFSTRLRGFVQGSGVPQDLSTIYTNRLDLGTSTALNGSFKNMVLNQQTFFETGVTVAAEVLKISDILKIKVGGTLKYLSGARNVFLKINSANYAVRILNKEEANLDLSNVNYEYGSTNSVQDFSLGSLYAGSYGSGWGYDLGATVEIGQIKYREDYRSNYIVRLGAAITDIGSVSYNTSGKIYSGTINKIVFDQNKIISLYDNSVKGLEATFPKTNPKNYALTTTLPQTLNLDADVQLVRSFFVNMTLIQPMKTDGTLPTTIQQPRFVSLTPRFEDADAEFSLPISWIEGNTGPTVGLSARFGPVFIGFSNFSGLLRINEPRSTMVYLGLNFFKIKRKENQ